MSSEEQQIPTVASVTIEPSTADVSVSDGSLTLQAVVTLTDGSLEPDYTAEWSAARGGLTGLFGGSHTVRYNPPIEPCEDVVTCNVAGVVGEAVVKVTAAAKPTEGAGSTSQSAPPTQSQESTASTTTETPGDASTAPEDAAASEEGAPPMDPTN